MKGKKLLSFLLTVVIILAHMSLVCSVNAEVSLSNEQILQKANSLVGSSYKANYCLEWLATVFWQGLGAPYSSACCAYMHGQSRIVSTSRANIPIGANVYFSGSNVSHNGHNCGHIGVYIGDDKILSLVHYNSDPASVAYARINTISQWNSWGYPYIGWGYPDGVKLLGDYSYENLEFRDVVYPKAFRINTTNGWFLQGGALVSDVNLTSIQSIITRDSDGAVIDNYTKTGLSGKTFAIKSIDTSVKFSKIQTAGNYTWTLIGKDSNNRTVTLEMPFTAVSSGSTVTDKMSMHADAVLVSSIDLKEKETMRVGEKVTLTATVAPDDATYKKLNWESSDTSIATVDENGVVTGVTQGSTTITASATDESGQFDVCEITVKPIADTLEFRDVVYPKTFRINTTNGWFIQGGTLVSDVELTSIQSIITRDSDGVILAKYTKDGLSGNTFAIKSIDSNVYFSNIQTAGNYTWTLIGKDSNNRTVTLEMPFTAVSSGSTVTDTAGTAYPLFVPVSEIVFTKKSNLENDDHIGASAVYSVQVLPTNATNKELTFSIDDELVVSIYDIIQVSDQASMGCDYFITLKNMGFGNMGLGTAVLTAAATDGSGVSAQIPLTVVTNITDAQYYAYKSVDSEILDLDNIQLEVGDCFRVGVNWQWSYQPDTYDCQFVLEETSGLEGQDDDSRHSGWFVAKKPGTWYVYLDFFENDQLILDINKTYEVHVSCSHPSSAWVTVREATADQEGLEERRCSVCGETLESKPIPKPEQPSTLNAQLNASATAMQKDGTFTITLSLENNPGIGFIVIQSDAAGQGITLEKAEAIGAAAGASVSYGTNATLSSTASISGESGILLLTFKSEAMEEATIQFSCGQCFTVDEDTVSVSGTSVKVAVVKRIPGDATDDGAVDGRDVLRLMKYFAGQSVTFNSSNADVTGDGTVDGRDVLRLMKYFAGQSVILQ